MLLIDKIAEQRIAQANQNGELDNLKGAGKPVKLDDDQNVPECLRAGYRILKNAGYLPPELEARREISNLRQLLASIAPNDVETKNQLTAKLNYLLMKINLSNASLLAYGGEYYQKLQRRLSSNNS